MFIAAAVLLGGLLSATLVRMAPGFESDERLLDSRLSSDSLQAIKAERAVNGSPLRFYANYLRNAAHGDLGTSQSLGQPVSLLLRERMPVTLRLTVFGLLLGWLAALSLALAATASLNPTIDLTGTLVAGAFLCLPTAVLALGIAFFRTPAFIAVALVILPRVFRYTRNLLARSYQMPHVLTARAKGISELRVLLWHVLPACSAQMLALAGISVSIAFGACIPIETLCGIAGIGQLAWQAAIGRDLPMLVNITVLVTVVTLAANSGSELLTEAVRPQAS